MAMRTYQFAMASAAFTRPSSRHLSSVSITLKNPTCRRRLHGPSPRHRPRHTVAPCPCWRGYERHAVAGSQCHSSPSSHQRWFACFHPAPYSGSPAANQRNVIAPHRSPSTRLFGSKPGSPNARPGAILLDDDRDDPSSTPINLDALRRTVETTRDIIGYPTYDVSLSLIDDDYMQEINGAARGVGKPTDVLSFCFQDNFIRPGVLGDVDFDVDEYYNLGDMLIDVDYVKRRCEEDKKLHAKEGREKKAGDDKSEIQEGEVVRKGGYSNLGEDMLMDLGEREIVDPDAEEEDGYEYEDVEVVVDEYDDRGVAPAMQYVYDPEIRIHMLVVHGMLHLVGYDHIEDDDYELMVVREDEVLAELRRRLGDDFGIAIRLPAGDAEHIM